MARTVEDAVRVLDAIAGYDPADPITERSEGQRPASYLASLDKDGLRGVRLGLLRRYVDTPTTDPEIRALTDRALQDLRRLGAEVVDPFDIPDYPKLIDNIWCDRFQHDVNAYLRARPAPPGGRGSLPAGPSPPPRPRRGRAPPRRGGPPRGPGPRRASTSTTTRETWPSGTRSWRRWRRTASTRSSTRPGATRRAR